MSHARACCCTQDCLLENPFVVEFGQAAISLTNSWTRTTERADGTTVSWRTTSGLISIPPMKLGFVLLDVSTDPPRHFWYASCGYPVTSAGANPLLPITPQVGVMSETRGGGGGGLDQPNIATYRRETRLIGIKGIGLATTPGPPGEPRDIHRLTYLLYAQRRDRYWRWTSMWTGEWDEWGPWADAEIHIDILSDTGNAAGTSTRGTIPMKCGTYGFVPQSDFVVVPGITNQSGDEGLPQTRPVMTFNFGSAMYPHGQFFSTFGQHSWTKGYATIPGSWTNVYEVPFSTTIQTDEVENNHSANITMTLRNPRPDEPYPFCPGRGRISSEPPIDPARPSFIQGTDDQGNSTRFGTIDPGHDVETERRALNQGGDCGCSPATDSG